MTERTTEQAILELLADGHQRKVAFVVAKVAKARESDDELSQVEAAIKRLIAIGKLKAAGDISNWRHSEIRLVI